MAKPTQLQFGDFPAQSPVMEQQDATPVREEAEEQPMPLTPPVLMEAERRSSRSRKTRTVYDAQSGTYKVRSSVPDDL